ncbi:hypothetical protein FJT64_025637 [Amphibalanus amphitrite]|uniref:Uncharacterized protein n=1 Tax=Amphibalanus amphitrite TaxID=1232801 RepID=A0A6A4WK22_AMPAM|nr:hypothetical protein FJT64_025637 [Amphibalanus amphitrite]
MANTIKLGIPQQLGVRLVLLLLVSLSMVHRCASTCPANHCNSGGICFRINQVMHYDVAKCFRIACRSSAITGVSSVVRMEDVGDCGQCCEYNGDIYAVDEEVFFEDDNCTRRCAGQDVWSDENESVTEYAARLRRLAKPCQFPSETLPEMLRDRLVCGIRDTRLQARLLSQTSLTMESALALACTSEAAEAQAQEIGRAESAAVPAARPLAVVGRLEQRSTQRAAPPRAGVD